MAEVRAEERVDDSAGVRVPPPLIYLAGLLLGWLLERVWPTPNLPRVWAVAAAAAGLVLSGLLDVNALRWFIRSRTPAEPWKPSAVLVTSGPYRFTRNPMYVGMAVLYAGLALAFGWWWSMALLVVVLLVVRYYVIAREERYLERRFGEEYLAFKRRVRRWV